MYCCDLKNPKLIITIIQDGFNQRSKWWWLDRMTSPEGSHIEPLTIIHSLNKLILNPTHLLPNSSSCIYPIFTDHPCSAVSSSIHSSFHLNCHHQITYCIFNPLTEYHPPYNRLVWDKKCNASAITNSLN